MATERTLTTLEPEYQNQIPCQAYDRAPLEQNVLTSADPSPAERGGSSARAGALPAAEDWTRRRIRFAERGPYDPKVLREDNICLQGFLDKLELWYDASQQKKWTGTPWPLDVKFSDVDPTGRPK